MNVTIWILLVIGGISIRNTFVYTCICLNIELTQLKCPIGVGCFTSIIHTLWLNIYLSEWDSSFSQTYFQFFVVESHYILLQQFHVIASKKLLKYVNYKLMGDLMINWILY